MARGEFSDTYVGASIVAPPSPRPSTNLMLLNQLSSLSIFSRPFFKFFTQWKAQRDVPSNVEARKMSICKGLKEAPDKCEYGHGKQTWLSSESIGQGVGK